MNDQLETPKSTTDNTSQNPMKSIILGLFASLPYVIAYIAVHFKLFAILRNPLFFLIFFASFISGFGFGIWGIVSSSKVIANKSVRQADKILAYFGIILSIGGIVGNIWFYLSCQFCQ